METVPQKRPDLYAGVADVLEQALPTLRKQVETCSTARPDGCTELATAVGLVERVEGLLRTFAQVQDDAARLAGLRGDTPTTDGPAVAPPLAEPPAPTGAVDARTTSRPDTPAPPLGDTRPEDAAPRPDNEAGGCDEDEPAKDEENGSDGCSCDMEPASD
jgi:hypothetical protein